MILQSFLSAPDMGDNLAVKALLLKSGDTVGVKQGAWMAGSSNGWAAEMDHG